MSTPAETPQIQRTDENSTLTERIWPVGVHIPVWLDNDCPSCGSAPCDPHPDTLACKECEDEWPCNIAANAAEELDRMAEFIGGNPGHVLRWRASALRGVIPGLAPVSSSEDTPAPHVHTDTCMCEMYDLEVIGARECTHCGGHTGGPCGSRCPVAYDEIVTPARVWQEGDDEPEGVDLVHDIDALDQNELVYARRMPDGLWRWAFTLDEPLGKRGDMPWQKLFAVATGRLAEVLAEVPAGGEPA